MITGLIAILIIVLVLPFVFKKVEEELEIFLFIMGLLAVTVSGLWSLYLLKEALIEPVKITIAVLIAGIIFKYLQKPMDKNMNKIMGMLGRRFFVFLLVVLLGLLSSVITAIVAALVLVEIIGHLKMDKKSELMVVVLSCFSIGMGAALTPIGEPLSTIAIGKLAGPPHNAGFWFLFRQLWAYVIPGVFAMGIFAAFIIKDKKESSQGLVEKGQETFKEIFIRTGKIYLFVMALVFLGTGFKPIVDEYISKIPAAGLYWINIISAVLDNATLAAAEIGPNMTIGQIDSAIIGLILAGGILIPGNIPNIISASKLGIKSKEWAKIGLPVGLVLMAVYFVALTFTGKF